jgi:hypothetical protein
MKTKLPSIIALMFTIVMLGASLPIREAGATGCAYNIPCPPNTTASISGMSCIEGCCGSYTGDTKYCLEVVTTCTYSNGNTTNAISQGCYVPGFSYSQPKLCKCGYQDDEL